MHAAVGAMVPGYNGLVAGANIYSGAVNGDYWQMGFGALGVAGDIYVGFAKIPGSGPSSGVFELSSKSKSANAFVAMAARVDAYGNRII